jgi:adenylate cyclase
VEKTAAKNNKNINIMSANTTEATLSSIYSNVAVFLNEMETNPDDEHYISFFFTQKPEIAAVIMPMGDKTALTESPEATRGDPVSYINLDLLEQNESEVSMIDSFLQANPVAVSRAQMGETLLMNAAPYFKGVQILTLIFPKQTQVENKLFLPVAVFFLSQDLTESFGTGTNSSFLTNDSGDVLIHSDQDMVQFGQKLTDNPFVRDCWNSGRSVTSVIFTDEKGKRNFGDFEKLNGFQNVGVFTTTSSDVVFEGVISTTRRNIIFGSMVAFLSVLFIWFFSKHFTQPIYELTRAVKQISSGDYSVSFENKINNEIGLLSESILSMSNTISNFERFTNRVITRLSREGVLRTEGVNKNATLFFSDIRSFTSISEKMQAVEVVEFLNEYMERMVACVHATGGAIDKFIGDAIMAHWGAIETSANETVDALNGVRAALLMRASLQNFNSKRHGGPKAPRIKIGCGLNSGKVIAGQIGSKERVVYTVIGETVNFADKTESLNKAFGTEILITEHTWKLIKKFIIAEETPSVQEGKTVVRIFAVINISDEEEGERLLKILDDMPYNDPQINRKCVGKNGPQTLEELRLLLGIEAPDLNNLNLDELGKKYSIIEEPPK